VSDLDGSNVGDNLWQLGPLAIDNQGGIGYSWAASSVGNEIISEI
jgi:hypothetical protein